MAKKQTPLMKQYEAIKAKNPDAILLFRVGDFYETFGQDAVKASKVLNIVLTARANGAAAKIELAGFPHHSLDNYLPKLVRAGYRVAICDQLETPAEAEGKIVRRGVTELVTPGLSLNDNILDSKKNNFLASLYVDQKVWGISLLDLSTGEFLCATGDEFYIQNLLISFSPAEVIFCRDQKEIFDNVLQDNYATSLLENWVYQYDQAVENLTTHFKTVNLKGFGIEEMPAAICAAAATLRYLEDTHHNNVSHISHISRIEQSQHVWLDRFSIRNLELIYSIQEDGIPLIDILDQTVTPMGARMLKKWIVLPLKSKKAIDERLQIVDSFFKDTYLKEDLRDELKMCGDLERLITKLATGRINPREIVQLKKSLKQIAPIKALLNGHEHESVRLKADQLHTCELLVEKIEKQILEEAGIHSNQGNIIKEGVDDNLDELKKIAFSGKEYLLQIQKRETERTGISSLKIAYNKVYGYYLEVTHAHKDKVPEDWIRKQTLTSAERYITPELKEYEEKIVNAEDQLCVLEQRIFSDLVQDSMQYIASIQTNAQVLATLDCLISFAHVAMVNDYCAPEVSEDHVLEIKGGRHPVIEQTLPPGEHYIPNDIFLDDQTQQIMIITGPNMAGKSALLRQTALICIMAQMGSFVPAKAANIGLVDKVFTRVGAADNLSKGESTFMVEMTETASILNNLSDRSLVIMDEIGRGTSTYDGISIAWSIVEYLHNHPKFKVKTLFATHYHELNQLTKEFDRIKNFNVSVKEVGDKVVFLRKLKKGGSEHSFGIHVAQMAGMPNQVVLRASDIMHFLEKDKSRAKSKKAMASVPKQSYQLSMFDTDPRLKELNDFVNKIDINTISPVEALLKLNEIKQKFS